MADLAVPIGEAVFASIDVASATTTSIGATEEWRVRITGTTTITSFGTGVNKIRFVTFAAALTLTYNGTSLILEGGASITTAAGDTCIAMSDSSSNWTVSSYRRANGHPLITGQATIASDTTTELGSVLAQSLSVTGTTTITGFGSTAPTGALKFLTFTGALTLTHNATSLILPTEANITTRAGDTAIVQHEGSGNWRCLSFQRKEGPAVVLRASGDRIGIGAAADGSFQLNVGGDGKAQFGTLVRVPNGSVSAVSVAIGAADRGVYATGSALRGAVAGVDMWEASANEFLVERDAGIDVTIGRYENSASAAIQTFNRSRGTKASKSALNQSDIIGTTRYKGRGSSADVTAASWSWSITEPTPSDAAMGARFSLSMCAVGSASLTEFWRGEHATGLSMFGANVVIDQNRHFRLRSYTVAGLPSASPAGQMVFASDDGAGVIAVSDGSNWVRGSVPDVQTFTADGTWTKPSWCTNSHMVCIEGVGGGGGGGSGRRGASLSARCGGGGGAGGAYTRVEIPASALGATETVTIGQGGAGGAAQTVNDTNGNTGTAGTNTTVGSVFTALGGNAGVGGTATAGTGGTFVVGSDTGLNGGAAGASGAATGNITPGSGFGGRGGAGGGGIDNANVERAGGNGGHESPGDPSLSAAPTGGAAGGANAGGVGPAMVANYPYGGGSGAGGGGSRTTAGGAGGAGGLYGGAGGGGGASENGNNSGAGGDGADGIVRITVYR